MSIHHFSGKCRKNHNKCGKTSHGKEKQVMNGKKKTTHFILTPTNITHNSYFHTVCTSFLGILYQINGAPGVENIPVCLSLT
jgi:hypothetical protein